MSEIEKKAKEALEKPAKYGPDIDIGEYTTEAPAYPEKELSDIDIVDPERLLNAGVDITERERAGSYVQVDSSVIHSSRRQEGIEVMSIKKALETYPWVRDYMWKLIPVDTDKFTARAALNLHNGYFIRALPGAKSVYPVQACLYLKSQNINQNVHNIVIAEEGSELHIITGCATDSPELRGLHVGISEFYIKKDAKISFTMIHNWAERTAARPRSAVMVEDGAVYLNNYICMSPVESLQLYPTAFLSGRGATARFNSILVSRPGSHMDIGSRAILNGEDTRCEMIARAITTGGEIISRGLMIGEKEGVKGHLECRGLILKGSGRIYAIPELDGRVEGVDLSHEAAVGKIAREEVEYLMARGLSEEEAVAAIVRGFMRVDIEGIPDILKEQIDRAIEISERSLM